MEPEKLLTTVASLFFVSARRSESDPPGIRERGVVLYGEALQHDSALARKARIHSEGSKLQRLEWHGPLAEFESMLQQPTWDHPQGKLRLVFGLIRRPPLMSLPTASLSGAAGDAAGLPPAATGSHVDSFVQTNKDTLAEAVVAACGDDAAVATLNRLRQLTLRDLRGRDVTMFGDVYIARQRSQRDQLVRWHTEPTQNYIVKRLRIDIDDTRAGDFLTINLRTYASDLAVLQDCVFRWERGAQSTQVLEFDQDVGGAWLRAWDANGQLVAEDANALLRELSLSVGFQTGTLRLEDKLTDKTRRAVQGGAAEAETLARVLTVSRGSAVRSTVSTPDEAEWSTTRLSAAAAVHRHLRAVFDQDAYFPAGADGRAMAVLSLAEKIAASEGAIVVDPFFDLEGGAALLARISNPEVRLTVVTWLDTLDSPSAIALKAWLLEAAKERVLPTRLRVIQLPGKKQPFHDRFLALAGDRVPVVYSLSNSLSGMAKDFPLVVARLTEGTAWAVQQDIDALLERAAAEGVHLLPDPTTSADGATAFSDRARRHTYFPGWKALLKFVVDPLDDSDQSWTDAACDAGLMRREPSGVHWNLQDPRSEQLRVGLNQALMRGPAQLGPVLHLMGEVDARGIRIDAEATTTAVEANIGREAAIRSISDYLRSTFAPPSTSRERSFVSECLRPEFSRTLVETAFYAWNGNLPNMREWPRLWGREFAFAILENLSPRDAVALSEDLPDFTVLVVAAGLFRNRGGDFGPVARAMLSAKSPFFRAFGAQALAVTWTRTHNANYLIAPDDVRKTVGELRGVGHPSIELLTYLTLWSRNVDDERRPEIVDELFVEITNLAIPDEAQQTALLDCLHYAEWVIPSLIAHITSAAPDVAGRLCTALLSVMPRWLTVSDSREKRRTFYRSQLPICQAFADAATWLAARDRTSAVQFLNSAMSVDQIERLTQDVSPLMSRPGRSGAVNVLGWIALCVTLAAKASDEHEEAHTRNRAFLERFGSDLDADLRAVLQESSAHPPARIDM